MTKEISGHLVKSVSFLQRHARSDAQRRADGGQDGDQRLDDGFPNVLLAHDENPITQISL